MKNETKVPVKSMSTMLTMRETAGVMKSKRSAKVHTPRQKSTIANPPIMA